MNDGHLFLSYSRAQLYFAESLTLELQSKDIDVWFDLQRLQPGTDWEASIQQGLDSCSGVVLVASRDSLASPYVRKEWEAALAASKPVYVVWYESVKLPPELTPRATINAATHFDRSLYLLVDCITEGKVYQQDVPATNRFGRLLELPPEVIQVSRTLLLNGILALLLGLLLYLQMTSSSVTIIGSGQLLGAVLFSAPGILTLLVRWLFLTHKINYGLLYVILFTFVGFWMIVFFFTSYIGLKEILFLPISSATWWLGVHTYRTRYGYLETPAVYRWMPKGVATTGQRETANRMGSAGYSISAVTESFDRYRYVETPPAFSREMNDPILVEQPQNYRLHYSSSDGGIARQVQRTMARAGHVDVTSQDETPDHELVIVTKHTSPEFLTNLTASAQVVPIIASNVRLERRFPGITRYQLVDYRSRRRDILESLARYLGNPGMGSKVYGISVTPERFDKPVYPSLMSLVTARGIREDAVYKLAIGIPLLILVALSLSSILPYFSIRVPAATPVFSSQSLPILNGWSVILPTGWEYQILENNKPAEITEWLSAVMPRELRMRIESLASFERSNSFAQNTPSPALVAYSQNPFENLLGQYKEIGKPIWMGRYISGTESVSVIAIHALPGVTDPRLLSPMALLTVQEFSSPYQQLDIRYTTETHANIEMEWIYWIERESSTLILDFAGYSGSTTLTPSPNLTQLVESVMQSITSDNDRQ